MVIHEGLWNMDNTYVVSISGFRLLERLPSHPHTLFLLAESKYPVCTRLAGILEDLSHDSVNRFLLRERYEPSTFTSIASRSR